MKLKRTLAIVLAVLMAITVIPAAAFAMNDPAPEKGEEAGKAETLPEITEKPKEEIALLGDNLFIDGTDLYYTNSSPGFIAQSSTTDGTTYYWIESNNYHQANTEATFTLTSFY
ncbi:MAG: hypothetical protein IIZ56_02450, partial [Clostridia bacterium]|nr:hypothetical protein [Clostridia bacterium]